MTKNRKQKCARCDSFVMGGNERENSRIVKSESISIRLIVLLCEICKLCLIYYSLGSEKHSYSRTSVARTLMARLPGLYELVLESFGKYPIAADLGFRLIFFCILKMVY